MADQYVNMKQAPRVGGGHIRKGAQKRMGVSGSLKTNEMWQRIGYDPYAENQGEPQPAAPITAAGGSSAVAGGSSGFATASDAGLKELARLSGTLGRTPGACKKCGQVGHLAYQCRNFLSYEALTGSKVNAEDLKIGGDESDDPDSDAEMDRVREEREEMHQEVAMLNQKFHQKFAEKEEKARLKKIKKEEKKQAKKVRKEEKKARKEDRKRKRKEKKEKEKKKKKRKRKVESSSSDSESGSSSASGSESSSEDEPKKKKRKR